MEYYLFCVVCLLMHILVNVDIFRKKSTIKLPAIKSYRIFVVSIGLYFLVDLFWGVFEKAKLSTALYVDTCIYFAIMGFTVLTWTRYVVNYLEDKKKWFRNLVLYTGNIFFLAEIILIIVNIFTPILFSVDPVTCVYASYRARRIMLYVQILMYFLLIIYSATKAFRTNGLFRRRYMVISAYSLIMASTIIAQIYNPYLPLYSIGCIIGVILVNSLLIGNIKEEYKSALEETQVQIKQNQIELSETRHIAYSDPLTNVHNKHAYVEEEERIDKLIAKGEMEDFAVVVFDLNGLKHVNDTKGHDAGDIYIVDSCNIIKKYFGGDHLYRFGGDEFVVILTGEGFANRSKTISDFERYIDECLNTEKPIISSGMSRYRKKEDNTYHAVFYRADKIMYARKDLLKEHQSNQ